MNPNLKDYIKSNFPLTKTDLFAVFLEKGLEMIKDYGFNCMVTMQSWMFLSSFEKFRKNIYLYFFFCLKIFIIECLFDSVRKMIFFIFSNIVSMLSVI